jgi:hypothetical protein
MVWGYAQVEEILPNQYETLSSNPSTTNPPQIKKPKPSNRYPNRWDKMSPYEYFYSFSLRENKGDSSDCKT